MAPTFATHFIDTALSRTGFSALSYPDPKQKWLIRKHLLSLIQDHPNFTPSTDTFFHNDGTIVNLLYVNGDLHISNHTPLITLTIWLHENYPYKAPLVYASSNSMSPIHECHPFVDASSGVVTSPYLQTWLFPKRNLSELVHNLVKIFSHDHPFAYLPSANFTHPSLASRMEALDRLSGMLHYDMMVLQAKHEEEMEQLSKLNEEMVKRDDIITAMIIGLDHENMNLKERVMALTNEADVLVNWLRVNNSKPELSRCRDERENVFQGADDESKMEIDCLATERGIEDVIDALYEALEQGVVSIDVYLKQLRPLAREQFLNRALLLKLRGPNILHCI
ncbi:hypothetical protein K2173_018456 [Erythroxylum novogranatense]|uniref:Protein ELC-like n=1 Tax=Erythroxylum novogranatense TaxID=1862640 RepID=A0AAV8UE19_9ROSI|nr:hypothetical protein K2173_018456 [Erythroxylum novogranatense]